jgi:zinc transporter 5/7
MPPTTNNDKLTTTTTGPESTMYRFSQLSFIIVAVEVAYGLWVGSLGLVSDGIHSATGCLGLLISLAASRFAKNGPRKWLRSGYSFGGDRAEVLAAFTNNVFLLFMSLFIVVEALHRVLATWASTDENEHHHNHHDHVVIVASLSLLVNLLGIWIVTPYAGGWKSWSTKFHRSGSSSSSLLNSISSSMTLNLDSVLLHAVSDAFSSCAVLAASYASKRGFPWADPLSAIFVATFTIRTVTPMFIQTARILAHAAPTHLLITGTIERILREIKSLEGVLEIRKEHFWTISPGKDVVSLILRLRHDADGDRIFNQTQNILSAYFYLVTIQIEKDKRVESLYHNNNNNLNHTIGNGNNTTSTPTTSNRTRMVMGTIIQPTTTTTASSMMNNNNNNSTSLGGVEIL